MFWKKKGSKIDTKPEVEADKWRTFLKINFTNKTQLGLFTVELTEDIETIRDHWEDFTDWFNDETRDNIYTFYYNNNDSQTFLRQNINDYEITFVKAKK